MPFTLPTLSYSAAGLAPVLSEQTLGFHHGKHHQTYVDNLNKLVPGTQFESMSLEEIVQNAPDGPIFNNAAQVWNHTFYFEALCPKGKIMPEIPEIIETFGSMEAFKDAFGQAAVGLFGSGWFWLARNPEGKLQLVAESNAGTPLRKGWKPILCFDVWEHAYYLDYQNRRAEYVRNLWDIVDWDVILSRL